MEEIRVLLTRGDAVESMHLIRAAVRSPDGGLETFGDAHGVVHLRSSAKPVQALAALVTGAADRFSMSDAEIALACGSHSGQVHHVETALGLLERLGLGPDLFLCGTHPPINVAATRALARAGAEPGPVHNNCSGKHVAMLAACAAAGWSTGDYTDPDHPLQVLNRRHVALLSGLPVEEVAYAIDGCSVPVFLIPLAAAARMYAALARPDAAEGVGAGLAAAIRRATDAVAARPEMVGGTGRVDTDLCRVTGGRLISKVGGEGIWCVAVRDTGAGIATKCQDGNPRGAYPGGLGLLRHLGLLDDGEWSALGEHTDPVRRNHRGLDVGRIQVLVDERPVPVPAVP